MKANIYNLEGKTEKQVDLPSYFNEEIRPDLINRAFLSQQSKKYQSKGVFKRAGLQTSATNIGRRSAYRTGMNIGQARVKKVKLAHGRHGPARKTPHVRKGRRAHPPTPEKIIEEKINKKERKKSHTISNRSNSTKRTSHKTRTQST